MNRSEDRPARQSVLLSFRFLTISVIGSLSMAVAGVYADLPGLIALLGSLVSILAGLVLEAIHQAETHNDRQQKWLERPQVPVALAADPSLSERYGQLSEESRASHPPGPKCRRSFISTLEPVSKPGCGARELHESQGISTRQRVLKPLVLAWA